MRFEITGNWKDEYSQDGMLYCAQRIEEMLMPFTSHLYKTPVYNSFLLAYEFLNTYSMVKEKLIDQAHLKTILEEFIDTFQTDIVVKKHFSENKIKYFIGKLSGSSIDEQSRTMHYLIHVMANYPNWCIEILEETIEKPKEKKKIEKALRSFMPMIIGMGYHPRFIYHECKIIFSDCSINGTQPLEKFLGLFRGADEEYEVYFAVDKRVEQFRNILENRLNMSFERNKYVSQFHYDANSQVCAHLTESALDVNGAAERAYLTFDLFMRYYRFLGNRNQEWIGEKCLVLKKSTGDVNFIRIGHDRFFYSRDYDDRTLGKNSERTITKLLESTGGRDFIKIDKIIRAHNTALSSPDVNNAFLNLWSVLEIVGVDEFGADKSKIKQILNNVVPVLKRNYLNKIVAELHDYLKANLEQDNYNNLLKGVTEEGTEEFKIACIIGLEKYKDVREKAYVFLEHYPLIRSRMYQLYEDVMRSKKKYCAELERYGKRLKWHIQRLYRTRNMIIHSGDENDNMISLVEHLHSYVDELILDIIDRTTRDNSLGTISNVLLDAQVFIESLNKDCSNEDGFTASEISLLLQ